MRLESGRKHIFHHNEKYYLHPGDDVCDKQLPRLPDSRSPSEFAEKRVWPQRRGLVVTHCHHSILCRRSREATIGVVVQILQ